MALAFGYCSRKIHTPVETWHHLPSGRFPAIDDGAWLAVTGDNQPEDNSKSIPITVRGEYSDDELINIRVCNFLTPPSCSLSPCPSDSTRPCIPR